MELTFSRSRQSDGMSFRSVSRILTKYQSFLSIGKWFPACSDGQLCLRDRVSVKRHG